MNHSTHIYSGDNLPNTETGESIGKLLGDNYPESYSEDSKTTTLSKRNTSEKINNRIDNGFIYITIEDTQNKVIGFLEMRSFEVEGGFYIQLCWLVIDKLYQGQGLASELNKEFEQKAQEIGKDIKGNWCLQLMTGKNNPAQAIYLKWGYEEYKRSDNDIFMIKDL